MTNYYQSYIIYVGTSVTYVDYLTIKLKCARIYLSKYLLVWQITILKRLIFNGTG